MNKSKKKLSKEETLKCIAREQQLMLNPTVEFVHAMYGNNQNGIFEA